MNRGTLSTAAAIAGIVFGVLALVTATIFGWSGSQEAGLGVALLGAAILL